MHVNGEHGAEREREREREIPSKDVVWNRALDERSRRRLAISRVVAREGEFGREPGRSRTIMMMTAITR